MNTNIGMVTSMNTKNKIFACIQTFVILFLTVCNSGGGVRNAKKSDAFPCEGHQCGCKSEADSKAHCCCAPDENQNKFHSSSEKQHGFRTFISSVSCKQGNNPLTMIIFTPKYMLESQILPIKESFLCFLFNDTSIHFPEVFTSPPEKPPKRFT